MSAASDTTGSLTVNQLSVPVNGQNIEYAIAPINNAITALLPWQDTLTFSNLDAGSSYYIYTRTAENDDYQAGAISVSAAITFYNTVFDKNSASGMAPGTMAALAGAVITLPGKGSLSRSNYSFTGWNTSAAGAGTNYAAGASYTILAANAVNGVITLYAKWTASQSYPFDVLDIAEDDPVISLATITLSHSGATKATAIIDITGDFISIEWYYGVTSLGVGSPFTLSVTDSLYNQLGVHNVTVVGFLQNGTPFETEIEFVVSE